MSCRSGLGSKPSVIRPKIDGGSVQGFSSRQNIEQKAKSNARDEPSKEQPKVTLECNVISYINVPGQKAPKEVIEGTFSVPISSSPNESPIIRGAVGHGNTTLAKIYVFAPVEWNRDFKDLNTTERMAWLNLEIEGQPAAYGGGVVSKTKSAYLAAAYVGSEKASSGDIIHQLGMKCLLK